MKTLSVLFTFALLLAANQLAVRLKHANALPADGEITRVASQQHSAMNFSTNQPVRI